MSTTPRRIRITYEIVTPESAEHGDCAENGFIDEDGEIVFGPHSAVEFLLKNGALEASDSQFSCHAWYRCSNHNEDFGTGAVESRSYHLVGFGEDELRTIYDSIQSQSTPDETIAESRRRLEDEFESKGGIVTSPGRYEGQPLFVVYLGEMVADRRCDGDERSYDGYRVDDEMRRVYPELGTAEIVAIWTDEQGFKNHKAMTMNEWDELETFISEAPAP